MYPFSTLITSFLTFYAAFGVCLTSFVIVFDVIIRNDFKYINDVPEQERSNNSEEYTFVKLPWAKDFPMVLMTCFMFSIVVFSVVFHKFWIQWFDRLLYNDDLNRVFAANNPDISNFSNGDIEVSTYKFKNPGLIKKITSTYFKKSDSNDIKEIKQKINKLKRRYKSRASAHSIDLENIMRDRELSHRRNENQKRPPAEEGKV